MYQRLFDSKYDPNVWSLMTVDDALMYDYKQFTRNGTNIGWSAILVPLDKFTSSSSFESECKSTNSF